MVATYKDATRRGLSVPLRMWALKPCVVVLERLPGHAGQPGHRGLRRRVRFGQTERCRICRKSVVSRWLALHMEVNLGDGEVTARDCAGGDQADQGSAERRFTCELCGRAVTRRRVAASYNLRESADSRSCSSCSAGSRRQKALRRTGEDDESKTETLLDSSTSPTSSKSLDSCTSQASRTSLALRTLLASRAAAERKRFPCKRCGLQFRFRGMLMAHERKHAVKAPRRSYRCELCGDAFTWGSLYRAHLRIHEGRLMRCGHCGERFQDLAHLRSHVGRHGLGSAGEPFGCGHCDLSFRFVTELRRHACDPQQPQHAMAPKATRSTSAVVSRNPPETLEPVLRSPKLQSVKEGSPKEPSPLLSPKLRVSPVARAVQAMQAEHQAEPPPELERSLLDDQSIQDLLQVDEDPDATFLFDEQLLDPLQVSPEAVPLPVQPLPSHRPLIRVRRTASRGWTWTWSPSTAPAGRPRRRPAIRSRPCRTASLCCASCWPPACARSQWRSPTASSWTFCGSWPRRRKAPKRTSSSLCPHYLFRF